MISIEGDIVTKHRDAAVIASALRADNLSSMTTISDGENIITRIQSEKLRTVIASVDDYLMDLNIAEELCRYISP